MKKITFLIILLFIVNVKAQESDKEEVQKTMKAFFEAFHKKDSVGMKSFVVDDVKMQRIWKNKNGEHHIKIEEFTKLIESIVSIPDSILFEEKLFDFKIQVVNLMTNVWVSYEFWYNNEFSHCGINSFQLFKDDNENWKIIYLVATRRKADCLV